MPELYLYSRENCHLCDEMLYDLKELLEYSGSTYQVIKIDGDPGLEHKYGTRVPMLVGGDMELCQIRLDREAVRKFLNGSP